jgi:hypothetical protein
MAPPSFSLQEEHQHHPNPPNRWWGFKFFKSFKEKGITFKAASTPDQAHHQDHHAHGDEGWGWEAHAEKEKHKLRYEILKLKAKKKIALVQNGIELKKLLSIILQRIVQALEWWRRRR